MTLLLLLLFLPLLLLLLLLGLALTMGPRKLGPPMLPLLRWHGLLHPWYLF
jgi:hypothetical protein